MVNPMSGARFTVSAPGVNCSAETVSPFALSALRGSSPVRNHASISSGEPTDPGARRPLRKPQRISGVCTRAQERHGTRRNRDVPAQRARERCGRKDRRVVFGFPLDASPKLVAHFNQRRPPRPRLGQRYAIGTPIAPIHDSHRLDLLPVAVELGRGPGRRAGESHLDRRRQPSPQEEARPVPRRAVVGRPCLHEAAIDPHPNRRTRLDLARLQNQRRLRARCGQARAPATHRGPRPARWAIPASRARH